MRNLKNILAAVAGVLAISGIEDGVSMRLGAGQAVRANNYCSAASVLNNTTLTRGGKLFFFGPQRAVPGPAGPGNYIAVESNNTLPQGFKMIFEICDDAMDLLKEVGATLLGGGLNSLLANPAALRTVYTAGHNLLQSKLVAVVHGPITKSTNSFLLRNMLGIAGTLKPADATNAAVDGGAAFFYGAGTSLCGNAAVANLGFHYLLTAAGSPLTHLNALATQQQKFDGLNTWVYDWMRTKGPNAVAADYAAIFVAAAPEGFKLGNTAGTNINFWFNILFTTVMFAEHGDGCDTTALPDFDVANFAQGDKGAGLGYSNIVVYNIACISEYLLYHE
jgi:hypothetical protein